MLRIGNQKIKNRPFRVGKQILDAEDFFIQLIKPEYNLTPTAHYTHGYKHSIETITKMRANYSYERREFAREINKDKALSVEVKAKMSKARIGKIPSNARPVIVYDALLMTRIAIFPSIARAAKFMGIGSSAAYEAIQKQSVIKGKYKLQYKRT